MWTHFGQWHIVFVFNPSVRIRFALISQYKLFTQLKKFSKRFQLKLPINFLITEFLIGFSNFKSINYSEQLFPHLSLALNLQIL
jgi:hypothetical protein